MILMETILPYNKRYCGNICLPRLRLYYIYTFKHYIICQNEKKNITRGGGEGVGKGPGH